MRNVPRRIRPSDITPPEIYWNRRNFLRIAAGLSLAAAFPGEAESKPLKVVRRRSYHVPRNQVTQFDYAAHWNNFYEFATDKRSPAQLAQQLTIRPWTVTVDGEVHKPMVFDIDRLPKLAGLEERIYRLRCVEAWSMVIPWIGYSLSKLLRRVEPTGNAKYVEFTSLYRPEQMPGQTDTGVLDWPYVEGLRLDEAMHPLTLLAFGLYGQTLPKQSGAPVRVVVPWKYGFKSAKSLVRIRLTETQPVPTWMRASPYAYGFYSNVNPDMDIPWSQATEYRIGHQGEVRQVPSLLFNGYAEQVASLYQGMDLRQYF